MNDRTSDYVLGSHDDELDRLGAQHEVWRARTEDLWDRAGFGTGQVLLDAGCGPGFASVDLARRVGRSGHVLGVDESQAFIASAGERAAEMDLPQARFVCADLRESPFDPASVDGIFMRWVASFLPQPGPLFERLATALRPGGALVFMDYVNYGSVRMVPGGEEFDELFAAFAAANVAQGGDYENGALAPRFASECGLAIEFLQPLVFAARPGAREWAWFRDFCRVFAPRLPEMGLVDEGFLGRLDEALVRHDADPGAFLLTPPVLAMIARRPDRRPRSG